MTADFSALLSFFRELEKALETLTALQQQKLTSLQGHDLDALNGCMKQEQALALALRSMEQRRKALLGDASLKEFLRCCPPELQTEARETVERLRNRRAVLESAQEAAYTLAQKELRAVNRALEERGVSPEIAEHYQTAGRSGSLRTDFRA